MSLRRKVLRADLSRSLADDAPPTQQADAHLQRTRGVYNVHPSTFFVGLLGALFAVVFALYAATREAARQEQRQQFLPTADSTSPGRTPSEAREIWVEVEP